MIHTTAFGYAYAPLAHGAVIAPATVIVLSTLAAVLFLQERLTRAHMIGASLVVAGIGLIAWRGIVAANDQSASWVGDILFVVSSALWATFTVLVRHWRLDALKVTAVVAVLSLCLAGPLYIGYWGVAHVADLPVRPMLTQAIAQGLVQAVVTIAAYSQSILVLGVGRAVLFPASVPAITVLIGVIFIGEIPTTAQIAGLALVSSGLLIALGLLQTFATALNSTTSK